MCLKKSLLLTALQSSSGLGITFSIYHATVVIRIQNKRIYSRAISVPPVQVSYYRLSCETGRVEEHHAALYCGKIALIAPNRGFNTAGKRPC